MYLLMTYSIEFNCNLRKGDASSVWKTTQTVSATKLTWVNLSS